MVEVQLRGYCVHVHLLLHKGELHIQVKKKMTCEEFIRNNRGINGGADLPHQFLRELYASISQNEIRISADQQASGLVLGSPVLWTDLAQQAQSPRGTFFGAEGAFLASPFFRSSNETQQTSLAHQYIICSTV